ncbi:unnamed protein product [Orchesella dallaii]|uniref:Uncharacterized protein n=1 Tax=Orchesella dallaii TaxID=48710 RepID=A0ABP1RA44_9HEXA
MADKSRGSTVLSPKGGSSVPASSGGGAKCRYEEIIKEISALDEMLEQYNDTSLPYITEFETSCGDSLVPTTNEIGVTDSQNPVSAVHVVPHQKHQETHSPCSTVSNLIAVNDNSSIILPETLSHSSPTSTSSPMNGNKVVDQNQNLDWSDEGGGRNNNGPIIHTSHLIQIPVVEPPPSSSNTGTFKTHSNNNRTFHSVSTSTSSSSSSSSEMNGNSNHHNTSSNDERHHQQHQPKRKGKGSSGSGGATNTTTASPVPAGGGGTYSKGTSYEILIPKITSGSFVSRDSSISSGKGTITTSSHSNRASIMVPVIESQQDANSTSQNGGKVRAQLNMGIFQPTTSSQDERASTPSSQGTNVLVQTTDTHTTHVPVTETGREEPMDTLVGGGGGIVIENNGELVVVDKNQHHPSASKISKMGNGNGSVSSTYITAVSEGKSSLGQSSSGTVSSAVMMMMRGDEEQWNFPSEKNLPRSLRKTRKTCFLDEGEGDGKLKARAESPYCDQSNGLYASSEHSVSSSDQCNYVGDVNGRNVACHKSPRVMPRKGIPSKCEIINKGDGNFALEGANKQIWNGLQQQQQHHQPHTTIVSTSSLASGSKEMGRSDRKKIYEDVVLRSQEPLKKPSSAHQHHHNSGIANNSSPSSTFTSSSGVSLSVRSNVTLEEEPIHRGKASNHHHPGKSRKGYNQHNNELQQQQQNIQQQQSAAPKPRVRQQIPSPGTEVPIPGTNLVTPQNQFIPFVNGSQHHPGDSYQSQISCTPITMSSHHSPDPVEIGTEEVHRDEPQQFTGRDVHLSSTSSPIKICHPLKSCGDSEFGEIGDNLGKTGDKGKARRGGRKGELNHSISGFEAVGQDDGNGSLPNQSQMMRMMMMMKSSAKNSVGSASSSSRSSSSSGSVSVKSSSSSSENNCADVFHENIVQDYPTNIFNVAAAVANQEVRSGGASPRGRKVSKEEASCKLIDEIGMGNTNGEKSNVGGGGGGNNAVVVMRAKVSGSGRGNLQQNANQTGNKKNGNGGGGGGGGVATQGNNTTLEIDDGYLSMINRNEAPLLWPEEFIENETFSRDEMKRLSVHLNDDETDDGGSSNSHSPSHPKTKKSGEKEANSTNKSEFATSNQNRNSMSGSSSNTSSGHEHNRRNRRERPHVPGRSSTDKTDYFSDDSLEMEGDDEMLLQSSSDNIKPNLNGKTASSATAVVRPSTSFIIPFNTKGDEDVKVEPVETSPPKKDGKLLNPIRKSNSQVSRIPKMVSPASSNRRSSAGNTGLIQKRDSFTKPASSQSGGSSPTSGFPKPCSFFIPFSTESQPTDGNIAAKMSASTGDNYVVNSAVGVNIPSRSTSLPSSRRNSSASTSDNKFQHHQAPIAWSISTSPSGDDSKLKQQQLLIKASASDNYVIDSNNKRVEEEGVAPSHPSNKVGEKLNGPIKVEEKVMVECEGSISTETANKLDLDEINLSITTTSISPTNSGSKTGDSLSKRAKFQKQETFLVSPSSRKSTTSSDGHGQRLIDPDNQSMTPSQDTALLLTIPSTHQNELGEQSNNIDLTYDINTTPTEHNQLTLLDNNDTEHGSPFQSQSAHQRRNGNERLNVNGEEMRNVGVNCEKASDMKKMRKELNPSSTLANHPDDSHNHFQQNYGATGSENLVLVNGGNGWEFDGKQGFDKGHQEEDNQNKHLETQESVAEELESVVKMFLKATADLLHPEEEEVAESRDTKWKSERGRSSGANLNCEPSGISSKSQADSNRDVDDDFKLKQPSVVIECRSGDGDDGDCGMLSKLKDYENGCFNQGESGNVQELLTDNISSLSDVAEKQPLMTSTPLADRSSRGSSERRKRRELDETSPILRKENNSSAIGVDKRLSFLMLPEARNEEEPVIEDLHEQPPAFIPEPPPAGVGDVIAPIRIVAPPHANILDSSSTSSSVAHPNHLHNLEGKVALDLLSQRITRKCPSPVENMSVSQFLHNKKNIWAMYDRPYDEDVLPPSFPRGFASRSQENLVDAMTHERLTKSFSARGQSSTLPLNCRPPPVQRRTSTFRNMFNKFRKHKTTDTVIPEGPEIRDEEAQSITSRETGPSEGKKRGFFSRLFRRSRKH